MRILKIQPNEEKAVFRDALYNISVNSIRELIEYVIFS